MATVVSATPLTNGGFETGDFTGWNSSNPNISVVGTETFNGYKTFPTEENFMTKINGSGYKSLNQNWLSQSFEVINDPLQGTQQIGWDTLVYPLNGYSGNLDIAFFCGNTKDSMYSPWAYIDGVGVEPILEPTTMLLFGSGLIGAAEFACRQKKLAKK